MKRLVAALLALLSLFLLASCGEGGLKPEDDRVVLTVGDETICYEYYRYVFLNSKRDMDGGDDAFWTEHAEAQAELSEAVIEKLLHYVAIRRLAEEYDIALTAEEKQAILDDLAAVRAQYTDEEAYIEAMDEAFMTDYTFYYMQEQTILWQRLYDHVTQEFSGIIDAEDAVIYDDIPKNFRRIRYVFLEKDPEHPEKTAEAAQQVYDAAAAGEDFDGLIREKGEDPDMLRLIKDGYYYTLGAIDEEVQATVETLKEGEIAPVVEVSYGYYVVQRLPLLDEYIEKNFENFRTQYRARIFNEMLKQEAADVTVTTTDLYDELTVFTLT